MRSSLAAVAALAALAPVPSAAATFALLAKADDNAMFLDTRRMVRTGNEATAIEEMVFPRQHNKGGKAYDYLLIKVIYRCDIPTFRIDSVGYYDLTGNMVAGNTSSEANIMQQHSPHAMAMRAACFGADLPRKTEAAGTTALAVLARLAFVKEAGE